MIRFTDPTDELKDRKRAIDTAEYAPVLEDLMDERELAERKEAAKAYATENEKHFVDYCYDCIEQSVQSRKDIRRVQEDCYNVYKEHEPASYADKAEWQSRTVVPKTVSGGAVRCCGGQEGVLAQLPECHERQEPRATANSGKRPSKPSWTNSTRSLCGGSPTPSPWGLRSGRAWR